MSFESLALSHYDQRGEQAMFAVIIDASSQTQDPKAWAKGQYLLQDGSSITRQDDTGSYQFVTNPRQPDHPGHARPITTAPDQWPPMRPQPVPLAQLPNSETIVSAAVEMINKRAMLLLNTRLQHDEQLLEDIQDISDQALEEPIINSYDLLMSFPQLRQAAALSINSEQHMKDKMFQEVMAHYEEKYAREALAAIPPEMLEEMVQLTASRLEAQAPPGK